MRRIDLIVVHCTASRVSCTVTPKALDNMHKDRGFIECGYHYYIRQDGALHAMRDVSKVGAHAEGFNGNSIGIAYEGGLLKDGTTADTRTPEQKRMLKLLLCQLKACYPHAKILGHRDLSPDLNFNGIIEPHEYIKQCPCFDAKKEYENLLRLT